ncbi:MAG: ribosome biogenesis GTPase Der [Prolixibacteraceae bacterium]|nr:ribosome biogenesis GTPase Der [Prolixibacteraceae bacterium]
MSNILAIVGRPNVGKSTLFNRLVESRKAIVDEVSGVTRDRNYGKSVWNGVDFSVIDTGGYVKNSDDIFEEQICKQVEIAIDEADVILFVVDVKDEITNLDTEIANLLRKKGKLDSVVIAVNKVDSENRVMAAQQFYSLGLTSKLFFVSAVSGSGTGDLLDEIVARFPKQIENEEEEKIPRYAVVGRPNVGKSSLINALTGIDRNIVTDVAGTTRDSIDSLYNKFGHNFYLVDTAGLRKKRQVTEDIEFYSVLRSIRAIEESDICLLMLDATRGVESQDLNIFNLIIKNKKGVVILVNKWDLEEEKSSNSAKEYEDSIRERIAPFTDVPILFISVLTKQRIFKALEAARAVYENRKRRIKTSELNNVLLAAIAHYGPPAIKGKYVKIKYVTQLPTETPSFALFCNLPQYVKDPYRRYIENKLRDTFEFTGVPIQIYFRKK